MAGEPHRIGIIDVGVLRGNESYLAVKARKAIQSLVESVDDDFDPPLSTRKSSIHLDFSDTSGSMEEYIDDLLDNEAILAFVDGRIAGILFYRTDYHVVKLHKSGLYVVVILVGKEYRGMLPEYDLRKREKDRMMAFRKQLPNALDFLRLETESSNSMPQSFQKITPYLERGVVKDEFNNVCKDMDAGRPFADALRGLAERAPSPDIESFVNVLIQSGNGSDNSIKDALERRAKASRQEYISILNNRIASVEPKIAAMLLPTMVGALVLVAVGPSISTIMNMLGAAI